MALFITLSGLVNKLQSWTVLMLNFSKNKTNVNGQLTKCRLLPVLIPSNYGHSKCRPWPFQWHFPARWNFCSINCQLWQAQCFFRKLVIRVSKLLTLTLFMALFRKARFMVSKLPAFSTFHQKLVRFSNRSCGACKGCRVRLYILFYFSLLPSSTPTST